MIAITHGHGDHVGDAVELWKQHKPVVVAPVELARLLVMKQGIDEDKRARSEQGRHGRGRGDQDHGHRREPLVESRTTARTRASPSATSFELENGTKIYFAGDTNVFGDMQLIRRLYEPEIAVLPIGDHYTMGPHEAARRARVPRRAAAASPATGERSPR